MSYSIWASLQNKVPIRLLILDAMPGLFNSTSNAHKDIINKDASPWKICFGKIIGFDEPLHEKLYWQRKYGEMRSVKKFYDGGKILEDTHLDSMEGRILGVSHDSSLSCEFIILLYWIFASNCLSAYVTACPRERCNNLEDCNLIYWDEISHSLSVSCLLARINKWLNRMTSIL